jgi:Ca-activated chloride channel family protein
VSAEVLAQYPLTVRITLTGQVARATLLSPSHTVAMSLLDDGIEISLQQGGFLDRDFVLLLNGLQGQSFASVARDSGSDSEGFAVMASFCPELPAHTKQPLCMKVLVDCSGSMADDSIQAARKALHEVMQELTEQDWISYSRFGSNVQHELSGLQPCHSTTIKQIAKLIDATEADLGGTEMNAALISTFELGVNPSFKASYAKSENQNNNMDVLLITDGDIWQIDAVVQFAAQSRHRIFAIGVGSAPAESLLREIAEKSGGACELVSPNQNVEEVIVRMFRRMRSSRCTELCVDWGQKAMWQSALPMALYGGDTLHLCARLATMPESAPKLTWVANKIPMHASAKHLQSQSSNVLPRLVASQQIAHLTSLKESASQARELALDLALKYQLVTDQTNLILVHVREEDKKAEGLPELSKVNHMLAAGGGGVGSVEESISYCRSVTASDVKYSMPNFEVPAYMRQLPRSSERVSTKKSQKTTLLVILQTFEASAQKVFAQQRFVRNLESLELPTELISLLDNLTVILGARTKAWAVVLKWMAEHLSEDITLSRQGERLLRQVLKDVEANVLQELNLTWKAKVFAFMVRELSNMGGQLELEGLDIPAFLRRQAVRVC